MTVKIKTFEDRLMEILIEGNEYGGVPVTKDNCDNLYDQWIDDMDKQELMDLAEKHAQIQYVQGARDYIAEKLEKLNKN